MVRAYTDGACIGNPGPAGIGVVVVWPDGSRTEHSEGIGQATNNIAELLAIRWALERLRLEPDVEVMTDSQYAIGVLSLGWRAKANRELISETVSVARSVQSLRFVHVRGHSGDPLNERADELANAAARSCQK